MGAEDCNLTLNKILFRLKEEFGLETSKSAIHRILVKLNLSYITPRPRHYKQDPKMKLEFKKNLNNLLELHLQKSLYFFDESRFGTHSKI